MLSALLGVDESGGGAGATAVSMDEKAGALVAALLAMSRARPLILCAEGAWSPRHSNRPFRQLILAWQALFRGIVQAMPHK